MPIYSSTCDSAMLDWYDYQCSTCPEKSETFDDLPVSLIILIEQFCRMKQNAGGNMVGYAIYEELLDMLEHVDHLASIYHDETLSGEMPYYYYYIATRFAVKLRETIQNTEDSFTKQYPSGYRKCFGLNEVFENQELPEHEYEDTLEEYAQDNGIIPSDIRREYRQYQAAHAEPEPQEVHEEFEDDFEDTLEEYAQDNGIIPSDIRWEYRQYEAAHRRTTHAEDLPPLIRCQAVRPSWADPDSPPPLRRCQAVRPEWAEIDVPEWAVMDDDEDVPATTQQERTPTPIPEFFEPSLFQFDPDLPITSYLQSAQDGELFMALMRQHNEWKYSDIVPDRLYQYLPDTLRECVDALTELLGLGWGLQDDNITGVQEHINNTPGVYAKIDDICNRIKGFLFETDLFAYKYVARFILIKTAEIIGNERKYEHIRVY